MIVRYLIVILPRSVPVKFRIVTTSITSRPYASSRWPPVLGAADIILPGSECFSAHFFLLDVIIAAAELVLAHLSAARCQVTPIVYFTVPYMLRLCRYIRR